HNLPILGPDSVRAAEVAEAAAQENRSWEFTKLFFANQGSENSGYLTEDFLAKIARGAGLSARALQQPVSDEVQRALDEDMALAQQHGFASTPSFLIGRSDGEPEQLQVTSVQDPADYVAAIDRLLGEQQ